MSANRLQGAFVPVKRLLPQSLWRPIRKVATALLTPARFAYATGHFKSSLNEKAMLPSGEACPWYTYPAIDFLSTRSFDDKNVLEFGGGQSTLWWAARARSVLTIEEDADWYREMKKGLRPNVEAHHVPLDEFTNIHSILRSKKICFDVIVVDGHRRREATALAFDYLSTGGAIILDNAEGYGFFEETKERKCRRIDFYGFAPGVSLRHCTSLVYVDDCFLLRSDVPIIALEH
jgi:predicted O-methyltransferase YrrM